MIQDHTSQESNPPEQSLEKVKYGAPSGPRRSRAKYDGSAPLPYPGHEAVAQFLAAPPTESEFRSLAALAEKYNVSRMTACRWRRDIDVMQRAMWLSMHNEMVGDLEARRQWPLIMKKAVEMAKRGNVAAMKFCESRAWAGDQRVPESQLGTTLLLEDLIGTIESDCAEGERDDNMRAEAGDR